MADIYINFPECPTGCVRGDIEFDLEDMLLDRGRISGGGAVVGGPGFSVDIEFLSDDRAEVEDFLASLVKYLRSLPAPEGTKLVIIVGDEEPGHRVV